MNTEKYLTSAGTADAGLGLRGDRDASAGSRLTQPRRKWQRILQAFIDRGERGMNRFDCYREHRDSVLNTTVSQLEGRGITILRRDETVPGAFGDVHCCRYWLAPESIARARELLR